LPDLISRAIFLGGPEAAAAQRRDFEADRVVIDLDDALTRDAARLAPIHGLRSRDAFHVAARRAVEPDVVLATWDRRPRRTVRALAINALPRREQ